MARARDFERRREQAWHGMMNADTMNSSCSQVQDPFSGSSSAAGDGIPEYVVGGSRVGDERLEALMREDYGVPEEEGTRVCQADASRAPTYETWGNVRPYLRELEPQAISYRDYCYGTLDPMPVPIDKPGFDEESYKTKVKVILEEAVIPLFRARKWDLSVKGYRRWLGGTGEIWHLDADEWAQVHSYVNTVQLGRLFWERTPSPSLDEVIERARALARAVPCGEKRRFTPEGDELQIRMPDAIEYSALDPDVGLLLGHFTVNVTAQSYPERSKAAGCRPDEMLWNIYIEVGKGGSRFDFDDEVRGREFFNIWDPRRMADPRQPYKGKRKRGFVAQIPQVVLWAFEEMGGAADFDIDAHKVLTERIGCK